MPVKEKVTQHVYFLKPIALIFAGLALDSGGVPAVA
jgi:hypothetical protein